MTTAPQTPQNRSGLIIDPASFLSELDSLLANSKVPNAVIKAVTAFVTIYLAGISVAGLHAWYWSAIPATLAALGRIVLQALAGQSVHEDAIREMVQNNKRANPLAVGRRMDLRSSGAIPGPNGPVIPRGAAPAPQPSPAPPPAPAAGPPISTPAPSSGPMAPPPAAHP